ncbi:josephin-2-like isoform X2 [Scyliorhinus torazame]|uniref:josephin-2-like isoform X2 n=1 Tax=Scyliorhinus torazame TaxID=75743 RepID=UPI003B58EAEB
MSEPPRVWGCRSPPPPLYHERQRLELCALHALNNLLQQPLFTQQQLDGLSGQPLSSLVLSRVHGFILNIPSNMTLGFVSLPIQRKHWVAVRLINGAYYNLHSKLKAPVPIGNEEELRKFLQDQIAQDPCELLLVVPREVEEDGSWLLAP